LVASQDATGKQATSANFTFTTTDASVAGEWTSPITWPLVAIHMAELYTGKNLVWDEGTDTSSARLWDPVTEVFTGASNRFTALFCPGHAQLPDGRLVGVGGDAEEQCDTGDPEASIV